MINCEDCNDHCKHIEELLSIFQQIYNNAKLGLNSVVDNETALEHIVNLTKDYVKEE